MFFSSRLLRACVALAIVGSLCLADAARRAYPEPARAHSNTQIQGKDSTQSLGEVALTSGHWERVGQGHIPMPPGVPAAHASALVALPAAHPSALLAFWFAGDRESAPNVQIAMSSLDRATGSWSPARMVVNRWEVAQQLGFGQSPVAVPPPSGSPPSGRGTNYPWRGPGMTSQSEHWVRSRGLRQTRKPAVPMDARQAERPVRWHAPPGRREAWGYGLALRAPNVRW